MIISAKTRGDKKTLVITFDDGKEKAEFFSNLSKLIRVALPKDWLECAAVEFKKSEFNNNTKKK